MKSIVMTKFGDIDVFQEIDLPKPIMKSGHVLIKVMATSVNPLDYKMRKGIFPDLVKSFPMVLHGDVAGIVEQVGEGVKNLLVGDEVYGCVGGLLDMGYQNISLLMLTWLQKNQKTYLLLKQQHYLWWLLLLGKVLLLMLMCNRVKPY
jgi:NADPH:quinone reductase-like Zn-dependent oxidoreductase